MSNTLFNICGSCGSAEIEEWGESGVFWLHCHACGTDGPDLEEPMSNTPGPEIDMTTLEGREEWYRTHECFPTATEQAAGIARVQWLQSEHQKLSFRRVLDIGCHDGFSTRWMLSQPSCAILLGVDLCASAITAARALAKSEVRGDRARYEEWNFSDLPINTGNFDTVVGFELIEHLVDDDARKLLQVMNEQLCSKGRAFLTTPHIDGPYGRSNPDPSHINLFDTDRLARMLNDEIGPQALMRNVGGALWVMWQKE